MKSLSSPLCLLSALVLLCGCGGGYSNPTPGLPSRPASGPPTASPAIGGNWQFTTTSTAGMPPATIGGSIVQSGGSINSAVHFDGSKCFDHLTTIGLTGTLTAHDVSLTSAPVEGQVTTFNGSISDSPTNGVDSAFTGTYTINGGCADGDHGNVSGIRIPYIANLVNGSFTTSAGETFALSGDDAQYGAANLDGSYSIEGKVTFTTPCFGSGTITPGTISSGSFILGMSVALEIETGNGTVNFVGTLNQDRNRITGSYTVAGGTCGTPGTAVLDISSPWDY